VSSPMIVSRPQGTYMAQMHKALLWLVSQMKSANFTPNNVFYAVYDNVGSYTYPIVGVRERNISLDLAPLAKGLNITIARLESEASTDPQVLLYLKSLYTELLSHEKVNIYDKVDSNLNVRTTHDRKAVTIFYDNDSSVINALDKIKNNESITSQPFTGDEVLSNVFMSLVRDKITGNLEVWNDWTFDDGTDATILKRFISRITSNKWLTRELKFLFGIRGINLMGTLVGPDHASFNYPLLNPRIIERGRFSISQLRIDKLILKRIGSNLVVTDYEYKYIEHHLLGTLVYNDTNNNGMMDIGVKNATIGNYNIAYPTIGDEAKFRFDMKAIGSRVYKRPTTTNNVLEFGSNFTNVQGLLQPIGKNQDISVLNSTEEIHTIDEVSTLFHFSVDNSDGSVALKFDYVIGEWDNAAELQGLSLNQMMSSTIVDGKRQKLFNWRTENGSEITDENANSTKVSRFRFADAQELFGEVRLDDIPYYWGDDAVEVNAVGQLIPMNLIDVMYGSISSEGDMVRSIKGTTERKTFLYSVSYPKWDGLRIVHDPAYVVSGGEGGSIDEGTGVIPGFEYTAVIFSLPLIALANIYRRKRR
ncbi:MAG: hypothetical protein ACTSR2_14305, partial [Candidatus Hodarchaeales archaeon]